VEGERLWLAAAGRHLALLSYCRLLCSHRPSRGIRTQSQIVGEIHVRRGSLDLQGSLTAMSVRDLLTFNLFLQFTDGLVSYQAFALGAIEANPVVAAAIVNWGMGWGYSTTRL
jgi:hypothetical protein